MNIRTSISLFLLYLLTVQILPHLSAFAANTNAASFQSHVDQLRLWAGEVGIHIVSLETGHTVFELNSQATFIPASLVKLFTSYAALKSLGPESRFNTSIFALQGPVQGTVRGHLWIKGEGDIFFLLEDASKLATQLKQLGVTTVEGSIFVDNSYFEPASLRVCLDEDCSEAYNPVISGTSLGFNSLEFHVTPGIRPRTPLHVSWTPSGDYVQIRNKGNTGPRRSVPSVSIRSIGPTREGRESFILEGRLALTAQSGIDRRFTVEDPASFFCRSFRAVLRDAGIEVQGTGAGERKVPPHVTVLTSHQSLPLKDLLHGLNRHSNNFMAETLLCTMGAKVFGIPGNMQKGLEVIRQFLKELDIPDDEVQLDNGSGLSRRSRASPRAFSRILQKAYGDPLFGQPLIDSLAVNGQMGTLCRRMSDSPFVIRGKTGTLSNVLGFAGIVSMPGNAAYAVTVILNHVQHLPNAREATDAFL
ncbi:MAG: D-alanyl-D-alanine carboxypeptidase/D-alanyl-D-alanine-endopeptidase, partial [Deltaproteobacteria bacterium]|nr:D-alanyl-D-alanine carboxypeptidase/D-alanyl-D-alanine-endopeptidase [Deltaproteobacteria bacterium]